MSSLESKTGDDTAKAMMIFFSLLLQSVTSERAI